MALEDPKKEPFASFRHLGCAASLGQLPQQFARGAAADLTKMSTFEMFRNDSK